MSAKGLSVSLCLGVAARLKVALHFASEYSIYHQCIDTIELTTAQTLILSLFYCLLNGDIATAHTLLSVIPFLPQLRSSFIGVWLRDDYRFRQEDVAKVLSNLAKLVKQGDVIVPLPVIIAFSGLEEKYDVFSFLSKSGDTTAQHMLACLNPLVTRATQAGPEGFQNQGIEARVCTETTSTQTESQLIKKEQTYESHRRDRKNPERLIIPSSSTNEQRIFDEQRNREESETLPIPSSSTNEHATFEDRPRNKKNSEELPMPSSASGAQLLPQQTDGLVPVQFVPIVPVIGIAGNTAESLIEEYLDSERMEDIINIPDIEGNLPIHRAAMDGRTDVVQALLQHGARPNDTNSFKMTPLQMAISSCRTDTIIFLLSHGASLHSKDIRGMTPLHHAAHYGDPEVIKLLLSQRVNKEAKDAAGNRPLHFASKFGHTDAVRLLINAGANRQVRDCEGFRPIDWALQLGDSEMFRILSERGHRYS